MGNWSEFSALRKVHLIMDPLPAIEASPLPAIEASPPPAIEASPPPAIEVSSSTFMDEGRPISRMQ